MDGNLMGLGIAFERRAATRDGWEADYLGLDALVAKLSFGGFRRLVAWVKGAAGRLGDGRKVARSLAGISVRAAR